MLVCQLHTGWVDRWEQRPSANNFNKRDKHYIHVTGTWQTHIIISLASPIVFLLINSHTFLFPPGERKKREGLGL